MRASRSPAAAEDDRKPELRARPSTFLSGESRGGLQALRETLIDDHSTNSAPPQQVQAVLPDQDFQHPHTSSSCISLTSSSRQIKPFSAIHKLFKRLYTTLHNSTPNINRNSAMETAETAPGPSLDQARRPRRLAGVQHVEVHHHHHHYHHHTYNRRSLDLPAHAVDHESGAAAAHDQLRGFWGRRRRHSEEAAGGTLKEALEKDYNPRRYPASGSHAAPF